MCGKVERTRVVIIDTSDIVDFADYGGMLYELKTNGICDGEEFQIGNGYDLLMNYEAYSKCRSILHKFGVKAVSLGNLAGRIWQAEK